MWNRLITLVVICFSNQRAEDTDFELTEEHVSYSFLLTLPIPLTLLFTTGGLPE